MKSFVFGVEYKIKCMSTCTSNIGETKRCVFVRKAEKRFALKGKCHSSAAEFSTGHAMDFVSMNILSKHIYERKLKIKEVLFINDFKPTLNDQNLSNPLNTLFRFITYSTVVLNIFYS